MDNRAAFGSVILAGALAMALAFSHLAAAQTRLRRISDHDFQALMTGMSEAGGTFVTDNIISNEIAFQDVIPELQRTHRGAYIGVGPEQNFTYIVALKPSIAFIVDLRRGNMLLQLMYKALVEMSADRADFLSRLFARPRPANVGADTDAGALFAAYAAVPATEELAAANLRLILDRLTRVHGFALSDDDRQELGGVYRSLYRGGPRMRGDFGGGAWIPTYAELMAHVGPAGRNEGFLGSEANFATLKAYESDNLIVPLVGNFSGDKTLRAVGRYLTDHRLAVGTFYASNVEDYLFRDGSWKRFAANLAALPVDERALLIRTYYTDGLEGMRTVLDPIRPMLAAVTRGDIKTYDDVIVRSRIGQ